MRPSRLALAAAAIAAATTTLVCLPSAPGLFGLAGLLLALGVLASSGAGLLVLFPQAMVGLVPALLPSPMFLFTFAWEVTLVLLAALLALHGWRTRARWMLHLSGIEVAVMAWTGWALFSGFWSEDMRWYAIGARRLLMGLCTLWVATRLPAIASRRWFDAGLIAGSTALAMAAVTRALSSGLSSEQALLRRPEVTNLGWGTANYVATLLLLFAPSLLSLALRGRSPERQFAWAAFALVTTVQFIVASRAATVLFIVATLVQLLRAAGRHRLWTGLGFAGVLTALLMSPLGYGLLSRFENLRELGSMTIRLWYFREGWRRLLDHLPWGMGLWQGFGNADKLQGIDPHNFWLLIGGDLGIPGLLLWAVVMVTIARHCWRLRADEPGREQAHTLLVTLVVANLHTLVEPTLQGAHYQMLFYWLLCGTLAYATVASASAPVRAPARDTERAASAAPSGA